MSDLPGYDDWKLATPPEYDERDCDGDCVGVCDCAERRAEDAYDRHVDAQVDEAVEAEHES